MKLGVPNAEQLSMPVNIALEGIIAPIEETFQVAHDPDGRLVHTVLRAYHSLTQSLPNNAWTPLEFNSEEDRRGTVGVTAPIGMHAKTVTASRFLVPGSKPTLLRGRVRVMWAALAAGARGLRLTKNGSAVQYLFFGQANAVDITLVSVPFEWTFDPQDAMTIEAYQNTGAPLNIGSSTNRELATEIDIEVL